MWQIIWVNTWCINLLFTEYILFHSVFYFAVWFQFTPLLRHFIQFHWLCLFRAMVVVHRHTSTVFSRLWSPSIILQTMAAGMLVESAATTFSVEAFFSFCHSCIHSQYYLLLAIVCEAECRLGLFCFVYLKRMQLVKNSCFMLVNCSINEQIVSK